MNSEDTDSAALGRGALGRLVVFPRLPLSKRRLLLAALAALAAAAFIEFLVLGLARKTFVFYAIDSGKAFVEQRMLKTHSASREVQITRYVEEALLGPVSANSGPLFPRETRLLSLLYRDGVVYVDLSEDAALPPLEGAFSPGEGVFTGMETLYQGIKRNFSFVKDVRFFIAGNAAYAGKFR